MRRGEVLKLVTSVFALSLSVQSLWAATPVTSTTKPTTTRVDVKTPTRDTHTVVTPKKDTTVNGHHVRVHARSDHSVNRLAGRNAGSRPIVMHDINMRLGLPPQSRGEDSREHIMLVHDEDGTRDVSEEKSTSSSKSETPKSASTKSAAIRAQDRRDAEAERKQQREARIAWHRAERNTHAKAPHREKHKYGSLGTIGAFGGANGDGGGGGESVGALAAEEANEFAAIREINLGQGSALIAHRQHVIVNTQHGKLHVLPHSAAFVTQIGKTVSIYNLGDAKEGAINFKLQGRELSVPVGSELLLTREPHEKFDDVNPVKGITTRNASTLGNHGDIKIYQAEYSPVSALDRIPQFSRLVTSKYPEDKKLANRLIKTASVLLQCEQPFAEEKPPEQPQTVGAK